MAAGKLKRIGILTAGGDCPGLNAVIRAVAKPALSGGLEVVGIADGYLGLIENRLRPLGWSDVSNILTLGGTILGSCNKSNPARYAVREGDQWVYKDVREQVVEHIRQAGLDAVVVIGGDGSMCGANELAERGVNIVGVPKTIDNDLWGTDITFGFDTAVSTAADALDKVHTTASSHHRVMVVALMGRDAGWLAWGAWLASGADVGLIPEIPFSMDTVIARCVERRKVGKGFTIIAAGEGAIPAGGEAIVDKVVEDSPDPIRLGGIAKYVAEAVENRTDLDSRAIVLGHVQRGGTPTAFDRILATMFGHRAFELMMAGQFGRLVVRTEGRFDSVPLSSVAGKTRLVAPDAPVVQAARAVGTSFGEA
ncbi:MAG: 6-phosphofructokinase [Planctomycetota bacterium]